MEMGLCNPIMFGKANDADGILNGEGKKEEGGARGNAKDDDGIAKDLDNHFPEEKDEVSKLSVRASPSVYATVVMSDLNLFR